jgi:hypothetical protein
MYTRELLVALQHHFFGVFAAKCQAPKHDMTLEESRNRELFKQHFVTISRHINGSRTSKIDLCAAVLFFEKLVKKGTLKSGSLARNIFRPKPVHVFKDFGIADDIKGVDEPAKQSTIEFQNWNTETIRRTVQPLSGNVEHQLDALLVLIAGFSFEGNRDVGDSALEADRLSKGTKAREDVTKNKVPDTPRSLRYYTRYQARRCSSPTHGNVHLS